MTRTLALHALILSGMVACRPGEIVAGVSDSTFVATMIALTRINQDVARDSASRAAARDSVLQSRDLAADDIERAARALEDDPERAMALWVRIGRQNADSTRPEPRSPVRR
jgi:hypothetical protein